MSFQEKIEKSKKIRPSNSMQHWKSDSVVRVLFQRMQCNFMGDLAESIKLEGTIDFVKCPNHAIKFLEKLSVGKERSISDI